MYRVIQGTISPTENKEHLTMFETLGALPWLDWLLSMPGELWSPLQYGVGLFATLGVLFTLALLIENRWPYITRQYRSVKYGDPALAITVAVGLWVINFLPDGQEVWYRDGWTHDVFHYGLLAVGVAISLQLKFGEWNETRARRAVYYWLYGEQAPTWWLNEYRSREELLQSIRQDRTNRPTDRVIAQVKSLKYGVAYSPLQHCSATAIGHMLLVPVVFYLVGMVVAAAFTKIVASGLAFTPFFGITTVVMVVLAVLIAKSTQRLNFTSSKLVVWMISLLSLVLYTILVYELGEQRSHWLAMATFVMLAGIGVWLYMGKLDNTRERPNLRYIHSDEWPLGWIWKPIRWVYRLVRSRFSKRYAPDIEQYAQTGPNEREISMPPTELFDNAPGSNDGAHLPRSLRSGVQDSQPAAPGPDFGVSTARYVPPKVQSVGATCAPQQPVHFTSIAPLAGDQTGRHEVPDTVDATVVVSMERIKAVDPQSAPDQPVAPPTPKVDKPQPAAAPRGASERRRNKRPQPSAASAKPAAPRSGAVGEPAPPQRRSFATDAGGNTGSGAQPKPRTPGPVPASGSAGEPEAPKRRSFSDPVIPPGGSSAEIDGAPKRRSFE